MTIWSSSQFTNLFDNNASSWVAGEYTTAFPTFNYAGTQRNTATIGYPYDASGTYISVNPSRISVSTISYTGEYVDIIFPNPIILRKYLIQIFDSYSPKNVIIAGSTNGTTWVNLGSINNTSTTNGVWITIPITSMNSYTYIKMIVNTVQPNKLLWDLAGINMSISFP